MTVELNHQALSQLAVQLKMPGCLRLWEPLFWRKIAKRSFPSPNPQSQHLGAFGLLLGSRVFLLLPVLMLNQTFLSDQLVVFGLQLRLCVAKGWVSRCAKETLSERIEPKVAMLLPCLVVGGGPTSLNDANTTCVLATSAEHAARFDPSPFLLGHMRRNQNYLFGISWLVN